MSNAQALLAHDKIDRYRPFGAFGKPVYQSHVQLHAMLRAKRGARFANYFAKPTYDPDTGELHWTAHVPGAARSWASMSAEEQARHALDLEVLRSGLVGFVQELRGQGGAEPGGAAAFASLLEQAMKVPAQGDFLYFVGEQPVIAFWGFENQAGASVDPALAVPQAPAPLPAELLAGMAPVAPEPAPEPVPPVAPSAPPPRRRLWWLWLLLALLLLGLLLLGLKYCAPPAAPVPPPPVAPASAPASAPAPAVSAPAPVASAPQLIQIPDGALARKDLTFLDGEWDYNAEYLDIYRDNPDKPIGRWSPVLRFDGQGGGEQLGAGRVVDGKPQPDCRGALKSSIEGDTLVIERGVCRTPDGKVAMAGGGRMECQRQADGKTVCHVVNSDGHRWVTELRKIR